MRKKMLALYTALAAFVKGDSFKIADRPVASAKAFGGGVQGRAYQTQTVITGIVIVVAAALGITIVSEFSSSLGTPQSSALSSSQDSLFGGFGSMISLLGPLLLVLVAVPILGYIQQLRG